MSHKAIISGVPGWLGNNLLEAIRNGLKDSPEILLPRHSELAILAHPDSMINGSIDKDVHVVQADLARTPNLRELFENGVGATVFHLAGVVHPHKSTKEFDAVNVQGTRAMLDAAIKAGAQRFIYVSSNSTCGCNDSSNDRFTESAPYKPYLNYGKSKMLAEQIVLEAHESKKIEVVIVRPTWFYGPHQPARQTLFFNMIKTGTVPIVGRGTNMRSMSYVDNVCQGLLLSESSASANGQVYWIADPEPYSIAEIIETVESVLKSDFGIPVKHKRMRLPDVASESAYWLDRAIQQAGFYNQKIHVLSEMNKTIACDVSKARAELGYSPKVTLREGMRRSIEWVLNNGGLI